MKKCTKCQIEKSLIEFGKHKIMKDGIASVCKQCNRDKCKEHYHLKKQDPKWVERERKRSREKYYTQGYSKRITPSKLNRKHYTTKYHKKYPEKYAADIAISNFKKDKEFHWHHWSYNEEHRKDVIQLHFKEHKKLHRYVVYDQERMMYRRADNNLLLDTRELHERFIEEIKSKP